MGDTAQAIWIVIISFVYIISHQVQGWFGKSKIDTIRLVYTCAHQVPNHLSPLACLSLAALSFILNTS